MTAEALKDNINHIKKITREIYIFTNHIDAIRNLEITSRISVNNEEKKLLTEAVNSLTNQLRILNNSIPGLVSGIGFYKQLSEKPEKVEMPALQRKSGEKLVQVSYTPKEEEKVSYTISDRERREFLENLSRSNLSINQLKKKFAVKEIKMAEFGKPNSYAKISNTLFRKYSNKLISKGYFDKLNLELRKINSPFVLGTYVSMIFLTILLGFIAGILLFIFLLFYSVSFTLPFITGYTGSMMMRIFQTFWVIIMVPIISGFLMYYYPTSEAKSLGSKMNNELPFVTIHMSAIATSGVEPISIFRIILTGEEYKYTNIEFRRLMNLINFHGKDIVTALKSVARTSPSNKLRELLDGLATRITSGGSLHDFLDKHAEGLLFDYRLEREKYTKLSETMMDIYIAVVIAAPMILLMIFVIIGSTGGMLNFLGLGTDVLSFLILFGIVILNIGFLVFLRIQQPKF